MVRDDNLISWRDFPGSMVLRSTILRIWLDPCIYWIDVAGKLIDPMNDGNTKKPKKKHKIPTSTLP